MASGAVFYDGQSARRRSVTVSLDQDGLVVSEDGAAVALWIYADLRRQDAPKGVYRITSRAAPPLARLETADEALIAEIRRRAPQIEKPAETDSRTKLKILAWSLAAAVSLVLTAIYLVPFVADRLAPFVPIPVEKRLGEVVDRQLRFILGGTTCTSPEGSAALARLTAKLSAKAALRTPLDIAVLKSDIPNAFALPGGRIYLLSGLLDKAESLDEVAGVLAHEMGHVAHRDGLRVLLQNGGSGFLLGLLFGDVTGGGMVVGLGQLLVNTSYSRQAEAAADDFGADLMLANGRPARPLGVFLARLSKEVGESRALALLSSHPLSDDRLAALEAKDSTATGEPLLTDAEWRALKEICKGQ